MKATEARENEKNACATKWGGERGKERERIKSKGDRE